MYYDLILCVEGYIFNGTLSMLSAVSVISAAVTTETSVAISASSTFNMMFNMPIMEQDYEATSAIILESFTSMSRKYQN